MDQYTENKQYRVLTYDSFDWYNDAYFQTLNDANDNALYHLQYAYPRTGVEVVAVKVEQNGNLLWTATSQKEDWLNMSADFVETGGVVIRPKYTKDLRDAFPQIESVYEFFQLETAANDCYAYHGEVDVNAARGELDMPCCASDVVAFVAANSDIKSKKIYPSFSGNNDYSVKENYKLDKGNVEKWLRLIGTEKNETKTNPLFNNEVGFHQRKWGVEGELQ